MENISSKVSALQLSAIKRMTLLGKKHQDPVFLSWGRPSESTPQIIAEYVINELKSNPEIGKYTLPHGLPELRQTIAMHHNEMRGIEVNPEENIIVTAGAMEAMFIIMQTLLNEGDEVLITNPGFTSYLQHITLAGGKVKFMSLSEDSDWDLNPDEFEKNLTDKTKVAVLTSPNNPTGSVFSKKAVEKIVQIAHDRGVYIISDEIYDFLLFGDGDYFVPSMIQNKYDNVISVYSLSKRYSMTGWRVGYIIASKDIIGNIVKVHDAATICACSVAQYGAIAALKNHDRIVKPLIRSYKERLGLICGELDTLNEVFSYVRPAGAYYIFPKIEIDYKNTEDFATKLINETGVVTVPGDAFGPQGVGHLRMAFCIEAEQIKEAFSRLRKYFRV